MVKELLIKLGKNYDKAWDNEGYLVESDEFIKLFNDLRKELHLDITYEKDIENKENEPND